MRAWREETTHAADTDELMGIEGVASAAYFDALAMCAPPTVDFNGRSRRPPLDVPNAALSYVYAILLGECVGALHAAGLEPSLGVLHAPTDKRPSLALDLMEEFRPLLVDQTVMALLRTRRLRSEHGTPVPGARACGSAPTARKPSSTPTRRPHSARSPAPLLDSVAVGAGTSTTRRS